MQFLDPRYFSDLQFWIVLRKLDGYSYDKISKTYASGDFVTDSLSHEAIKTCLKRSSLSLQWYKSSTCGKLPVLSQVDIDQLKKHILENSFDGEYIDVDDTLDAAENLRLRRLESAENFLIKVNCYSIYDEIIQQAGNYEATRDWLYKNLDNLQSELQSPRNVVINRFVSCTPEKIHYYTSILIPKLDNIDPSLRFCADETMLAPNQNRKFVVPNGSPKPVAADDSELPHITAMCCCNVVGDKMPLFIVLPNLKNLPSDLKVFAERGHAYFSSSNSGWQTRDTFLWFVICFINYISLFRMKIKKSLKKAPAALIVDGHKSRECPIALKLLKDNNIQLFVLPAHTSHVTQLFDVGVGSSMKSYFTDVFKKKMKDFNPQINNLGQLRYYCVYSAICAWDAKANVHTCLNAAKLTGMYPCNDEHLMNSIFVKKLPDRFQKIAEEKEKKKKKRTNQYKLSMDHRSR